MTNTPHNHPHNENDAGPPPRDELDTMLRHWHATNADKAAAGRDRLLASLVQEDAASKDVLARIEPEAETADARRPFAVIRRIIVNRYSPLAAAAVLVAAILPFVLSGKNGFVSPSNAKEPSNIVMAPEGGRLEAFDKQGNTLGPCALKHTDVKAEISGRFTRVTVKQHYRNDNPDKIEAVYTFPLSERSGVDRMTMSIGDRVIVGEVKERQQARRIYEQAKDNGRVASLLEQERPNIFTQSVANIEPGATIDIEISYVEMVAEHDGEFSFAFPTVVSPRYIPGQSDYRRERVPIPNLPLNVHTRRGLVLLAPASVTVTDHGPGISRSDRGPDDRLLNGAIASAMPIAAPEKIENENAYFAIQAAYADGSKEKGFYRHDGFGQIGGRWFYCPPPNPPQPGIDDKTPPGDGFAQPTNQVPDADRITPMPVRPGTRLGHDISISVLMDTGGPSIIGLESPQHKVNRTDLARNGAEQPRRVSLALANLAEIPNRDFVLKWKQSSEAISSRIFTHTGDTGNFFCVQLDPPAQVKDIRAVPRELVFVVDTSGSMKDRPISLCKEVMRKAIDQMRPQDTFNIITFAGATRVMWDRPRPNTSENRAEAQRFIDSWEGNGGTEMMTAIEAALRQGPTAGATEALTPAQLADLPADGRQVVVEADDATFRSEGLSKDAETDRAALHIRDDLDIKCSPFKLPQAYLTRANQTVQDDSITLKLLLRGTWLTQNGERIFNVSSAELSHDSSVRPLRIVMFLTDAEVGNDMAIIDAIKRNRSTTRVFPFGIGSSVNRFLIEQMAVSGGGEPEYVYANEASEQQAAAAVERFNRRTKTPVLTDISVTFNGVQPVDVLPDVNTIQDLYDNRPLTFIGRYNAPTSGTLTIKGQTAQGRWEKTIPIDFPAKQPENSSLPTLWARAKIDSVMSQDLVGIQRGQPSPDVRAKIITLGETFNVMSQFTSFVAVDKLRVTVDGRPRLIHVPIALPDQTNWAGFFGELPPDNNGDDAPRRSNRAESDRRGYRLALKAEALEKLVASNEMLIKQRDEYERTADAAQIQRDLDALRGQGFNEEHLTVRALKALAESKTEAAKDKAAPLPPSAAPAAPRMPGGAGGRGAPGAAVRAGTPAPTAAPAQPAPTPVVSTPPPPASDAASTGTPANTSPTSGSTPAPAKPAAPPVGQIAHNSPPAGEPLDRVSSAASVAPAEAMAREIQKLQTPADPVDVLQQIRVNRADELHFKQYGTLADSNGPIVSSRLTTLDSAAGNFDFSATHDAGYVMLDEQTRAAGTYLGLDLYKRGDSVQEQPLLLWWARTQPTFNKSVPDGGISPEDVRKYFYTLGREGVSTISDNGLSTLVAFGRQATVEPIELVTLAAAQLAEQGKLDKAKRLVCSTFNPPAPTGGEQSSMSPLLTDRLCAALGEATPDAERSLAVRKLADEASARILEHRRIETLLRKLAPDVAIQTPTAIRYRALAAAGALKEKGPETARKADDTPKDPKDSSSYKKAETGAAAASQSLFLTLLLADTSTKTLDALKQLGIKIESVRAEVNVVVARVPLDKLEELALMDVVKRIELVPLEDPAPK